MGLVMGGSQSLSAAATSWDWAERLSWLAAILALGPLAAAGWRIFWRESRGRRHLRAIDHGADGLLRIPADQPGGAVGGRSSVHGREALLRRVSGVTVRRRWGRRSEVWVLHGLGGSGKTTAAWAVAQQAQRRGVRVWWVSAADRGELSAGMRRLAAALGGSPDQIKAAWADDAAAAALVWHLLQACPNRWLLILDNADHADVLEVDKAPLAEGHGWLQPVQNRLGGVIVTSRDGNAQHFGTWCKMAAVERLSASDGARLLIELAGPDAGSAADATALTERFAGLPLALRLAGSYLASAGRAPLPGDVTTFRALLDTMAHPPIGPPRRIELVITQSLRNIWRRSIDHLEAGGIANARPLLHLLGTYADAPVPLALLMPAELARSQLFDSIDDVTLRASLEALIDLGLVHVLDRDAVPAASLHPLVRDAARLDAAVEATSFLELAVDLLAVLASRKSGASGTEDPLHWASWQALTPHATYLWAEASTSPEISKRVVRLAAEAAVLAGRSSRARGLYLAAVSELRTVADQSEGLLVPYERPVLFARFNLGRALRDLGRYEEAEDEFNQVFDLAAQHHSVVDVLAVSARHELARVLHARGRLLEAEAMSRSVFDISSHEFGGDDPLTRGAQYELARVLFTRGEWAESRMHFAEVYAAEARLLGEKHPDTLNARHQAAVVALASGQLDSARRDLTEILAIRTKLMGADHPTTIDTRHDLARVLFRSGTLPQAELEFRKIVAISTKVVGADHPRTLAVRQDLAALLSAGGRVEEAEQLLRSVLAVRTRVLGADHPSTAETAAALNGLGGPGVVGVMDQ